MRIIFTLLITCLLLNAEDPPGFVLFSGQKISWEYSHPKFDGDSHGDGVVTCKLVGYILSKNDGQPVPIVSATIKELPSNQFGGVRDQIAIATSNENGLISFTGTFGAAIQIGGKNNGAVYQSGRKEYIVSAPGYAPAVISLCLSHPAFKVILAKE